MIFSQKDKAIIRPLLEWQLLVGSSVEMADRRELWRKINDLEKGDRPPILVYAEGSWREIDETIELKCDGDEAKVLEKKLRRLRFSYENFGDDMVINPYLEVPHIFSLSDYGVEVKKHQTAADGSWKAEPPLKDLQKDLDKLKYRTFTYHKTASEERFATYNEAFGDLMQIYPFTEYFWSLKLTGDVINLLGMEEFLLALHDDPDGVHALMRFLTEDKIRLLDELERLNIVTYNSECWHIGSGGLGFTNGLPGFTYPKMQPVTFRDTWGLLESQETLGVSPDMFGEFIWPYQKQLAPRFGYLYYGCCEPIENRFEYIRKAENLRGISVSPWSDIAKCSELYKNNYTMFCKPNPGHVAVDFVEDAVKDELKKIVENIRPNSAAIILKDLHTVNHDLTKYKRWSNLARQAIDRNY